MTEGPAGTSERDHFIPARKIDVLDALIEHGALTNEAEREKFRQIGRLLGAIYHYEYFDQLERLRNDYYYFNPDIESLARFDPAMIERTYQDLTAALTKVLHGANFIEIPQSDVTQAHRDHALIRVNVKAPTDDYREVRFFRRGHHREKAEISEWYGWRKREIDIEVYDDVVLLVTMKNAGPETGKPRRRSRKSRIRPGAVLLKYFRDIATGDLHALFPDVRVVMSLWDRLVLGVPTVAAGIPILLKLASTFTVLFLVIGFYAGMGGSVKEADTAGALAALGGIVALGGLIFRQWMKFQRQSLIYQKMVSDNIYYRNVNNNAGIFDYIIGEAEEQECKEAFLAYYFLMHPADGPTAAVLDQRIEAWLLEKFGTDVDFECEDALAKLGRLNLLRRDGERLSVLPLDDALIRLDQIWDDFFPFDTAQKTAASQS